MGQDMVSSKEGGGSAQETRERILRAAAERFAEQGYARTTTRELAAAAGVNEVTLFRHFGSKKALFEAVLEAYSAPAMTAALRSRLTGDYRQDLLMMAHFFLEALLERQEAVRMMLCESAHFPELRELMARNPRELRQMLARYLEGQMAAGRVRVMDPGIAAQAFWGIFFSYSVLLGTLQEPVAPQISREGLVGAMVDLFVEGTGRRAGEEN